MEVLIGLVGVVVGFALQAVNGYLTERRAELRTHRQWLRQVRYDNYTALPDAMRRVLAAYANPTREADALPKALDNFNSARSRALMVADEETSRLVYVHLLRFAVLMTDDASEAEAEAHAVQSLLGPRITSPKEPKATGYSALDMTREILEWDDQIKSRQRPGLTDEERSPLRD